MWFHGKLKKEERAGKPFVIDLKALLKTGGIWNYTYCRIHQQPCTLLKRQRKIYQQPYTLFKRQHKIHQQPYTLLKRQPCQVDIREDWWYASPLAWVEPQQDDRIIQNVFLLI